MNLWDWAAAAYARPGVADACLTLQDAHGQNVPFLLWAAWARPDAEALAEGAALARAFEAEVVAPLRGVRRALKSTPHQALRDQVKAAELAAERVLLERLEAVGPRGEGDVAAALSSAVEAWGSPAPRADLARLAMALTSAI